MSALRDLLLRQIALTGPLTVADYMAYCLSHPEHGVYTRADPLGARGHFTTAPEISQMFGELTGLALAQSWLDQGAPSEIVLAELGPGRGTLMQDILRATRGVPGFRDAIRLHLVETSPAMRAAQAERLGTANWHDHVADLPEAPLFLIANEFFDALPVRQFLREGNGWRERVIGETEGTLAFGLSPPAPLAALEGRLADTEEGDMVELCATAEPMAAEIGRRIEAHGGAALIVDYGDWGQTGDTLQAISHHRKVKVLEAPGEADLTAHVDFRPIAAAAAPAAATEPVPQGVFLERLGIADRARTLAASLSGGALGEHIAAHRRLTHPAEMGHLFKVMGIYPTTAAPPPGLMT
ncbi:class I SAM-dependent methyltransferase [Pelagovum pacificum]|uniref:Class I SAM-dependent methyltransferase n=1 Tax=Pelagovum pacificum TaxID=2588711 RepID=A0A5C5GI25_9RHOB|nr:SAM-dependent methyltransferase [Pelagovum pacificum]QQA43775.1 SAM-dependent methyltransferase [Pelagovum pacificum]TNY33096.1 class I SAM-dependent methyltransferase [Pelagovum pacificum]